MKVLLYLSIVWSSINFTLSLYTGELYLGTIGKSGQQYPHRFKINCYGDSCDIEDVTITLSKGEMKLSGFFGFGETEKFCEGQPKNPTTGMKDCRMLKKFGLKKALLRIDALEECDNVRVIARGRNVWGIGVDQQTEVDCYIGTLLRTLATTCYIYCQGTCEIERVRATLSGGGDVTLKGFHGDGENSKFCEGLPHDGTGDMECEMLKKKGLSKARIEIKAVKDSFYLRVRVIGYKFHEMLINPPSEYKFEHVVGSILVNGFKLVWIHCRGPCRIDDVEATLEKGGDVNLIGFHGDGKKSKFCEGLPNDRSGIEKCKMLTKEGQGLSKARVEINAIKDSHKLSLIVRGYNLFKMSDTPPSSIHKFVHKVGSIPANGFKRVWIHCRGPCDMEEVEATLSKGAVALNGKHGHSDSEIFCHPANKDGIEKCRMLKKNGLSRARIHIFCRKKILWQFSPVRIVSQNCEDVQLTFLGYNLIQILDKEPSPIKITTNVGTLNKNQHMKFTLKSKEGGGIFVHISVRYKVGGDVRMKGPIKKGIDTSKTCPGIISDASITLHGYENSEEVTLTVEGPYLESVDYETTWST